MYVISIQTPKGLHREGVEHEVRLAHANHANVLPLTTDELIELTRASLRRLAEADVDLHSLLGSV